MTGPSELGTPDDPDLRRLAYLMRCAQKDARSWRFVAGCGWGLFLATLAAWALGWWTR